MLAHMRLLKNTLQNQGKNLRWISQEARIGIRDKFKSPLYVT